MKENKAVRGTLFSDSGNGKTHLAMELMDRILRETAPGKAWLIVDTSDNFGIAPQINGGKGPTQPWQALPFTFIEDLELIAEAIRQGVEPYNMIGGIILDEASTMAEQDVDRIYDQRAQQGKTSEDTPGWGEYRPGMIRFRKLLANLFSIKGLHFIVVAHEKGEVKDLKKQHAGFPIATYKAVKKYMTFVARVSADEITPIGSENAVYNRVIQIHPTRTVDAKSRLGTDLVKMPVEWFPDCVMNWLKAGGPDINPEDNDEGEITADQNNDNIPPTQSREDVSPEDVVETAIDTTIEDIDFSSL